MRRGLDRPRLQGRPRHLPALLCLLVAVCHPGLPLLHVAFHVAEAHAAITAHAHAPGENVIEDVAAHGAHDWPCPLCSEAARTTAAVPAVNASRTDAGRPADSVALAPDRVPESRGRTPGAPRGPPSASLG